MVTIPQDLDEQICNFQIRQAHPTDDWVGLVCLDDICFAGSGKWSPAFFSSVLQHRNFSIGVAEATFFPGRPRNEQPRIVLGFAVFKSTTDGSLELAKIAVLKRYRRVGVGSGLICSPDPLGKSIFVYADERDLQLLSFLRANGFIATKVIKGDADDGRDTYEMIRRAEWGV